MRKTAADVNRTLETEAPALYRCLSPLGRRAFYPPDIPVQAAEARGARYNATIGELTDGQGGAMPLPSMAAVLALSGEDRDRAFLYSPVGGLRELRERWREWQRFGQDEAVPSSLPFVTDGLAHGLSLVADLFAGPGRAVAVAAPFWGNYSQAFALRTGAEMRLGPGYRDGRFNPRALAEALAEVPAGEPAVGLLNFPSNPGGYAPTAAERRELRASLLEIADARPFVVLVDDAYAGLVYEESSPPGSPFWELAGVHEQLIAVKVDGATKEFFFFGGRVGFLTFGYRPGSPVAKALENKLACLLRSTVGSPVALSQVVLLQALRDGAIRDQVAAARRIARERYAAVRPLLAELDPHLLRSLPFNAGFFVLLELPEELGVGADAVRRHLLARHDTGVVAIGERYLRLAVCSVAAAVLPELLRRVELGVSELAAATLPER